ncbi:MAG TPA: threonine/serine exporter family protein [Terriglobales bacterium]|jgi:uncharacterized membrane protein YjjP (DUF1212 family)|nr:threonine/serine exporter family protein [Terriglobales bacterium]
MKAELLQPALGRESLEEIATVALDFGRLLMETGASARNVEEITGQVAAGLGAERVDTRVGYASLAITLGIRPDWITCMRKVGPLGVNQRLYHALRATAAEIERGGFTAAKARAEVDRLVRASPRHPGWVVLAVGVACAAFGQLLDVDWAGVGPIFVAAALGQIVRHQLASHKINVFLSTTVVAFLASTLCGLGARWAGSQAVARDMTGPVLLLVPGVPAFNAQFDILEGRPTLGSARAVWVAVNLVFITVGVWLARGLLGEGR